MYTVGKTDELVKLRVMLIIYVVWSCLQQGFQSGIRKGCSSG